MATRSSMKLKLLYLTKIFHEQSDESHMLSVNDLIQELKKYEIDAERKSIYTDIELLQGYGIDIIVEKSTANYYYLANREFELPELKLLIDAVQSSKFITKHKSEELILKIQALTSKHEAKLLERQVIIHHRVNSMNEKIYYNVDQLHRAIQLQRLVQFKYTDYTLDKQQELRRDGEIYVVSPYAMTWVD